MKIKNPTLQDQLASQLKEAQSNEKEVASLRKKIAEQEAANKPKSIMDRVNTIGDVMKIAKPIKEELAVINYSGKSKRLLFAKHMMVLSLISEVMNEGHEFSMNPTERRWYVWFNVSSGFVFNDAFCADSHAVASSASRLCLESEEKAIHVGKVFTKYYKNAIMMK